MFFLALRAVFIILIKKPLVEKSMSLEYDVASFSVQGKRERMEDNYYLGPSKRLFMVADGVALSEQGDEASKLAIGTAVEILERERMPQNHSEIEETLKRTVDTTQSIVRARFSDGRKGSTTLTLLLTTDSHLSYCSVGDSRLYVARAPLVNLPSWGKRSVSTRLSFHQLTTDDHSFIGSKDPTICSGTYPLAAGDCGFLLCTDGLYKHLQEWEWIESKKAYERVPLGTYFGKASWKEKSGRTILQYEHSPPEEVAL